MITRKQLLKGIYGTDTAVLTSPYGAPRPNGRIHVGEDADDITGDHPRLYAPYNCVVTHVRNTLTDDRGKFLEIKVGTWYILMQHDFEIRVRDGQRVEAGGLLGIQGGSGRTINQYRSHLHYEFAKYPYGDARRKPINPVLYFYPFFTPPKYPVKTVVVSGLRIRAGHYLKAEIISRATKRAYTIYETVTQDGYVWGRIDWEKDQWMALNSTDGRSVFAK
jgi:hypothetical protein